MYNNVLNTQKKPHNPNYDDGYKPRPRQSINEPGQVHRSANFFGRGNFVVQNFVTKNIYVTPGTPLKNAQGNGGGGALRKNFSNLNANKFPRNNQNKNSNGLNNYSNENHGIANNGSNLNPSYRRYNVPRNNANDNFHENKPMSAEDMFMRVLLNYQNRGGKSKLKTFIIMFIMFFIYQFFNFNIFNFFKLN